MTKTETINLRGPLKGEFEVPGDKSMTHRAIMLSSLAQGQSVITKPLLAEDCLRTMKIFELLGVNFDIKDDKVFVDSPGYQNFKTPHQSLYTGNSGTTTRIMAGLLSGIGIQSVLSGDESIGKRPMNRVIDPLKEMGASITGIENNYTPLVINPSDIQGIDYKMPVASAQVKSAILFASLFSKTASTITEIGITRNHTETMFEHYNIPLKINGNVIQTIPDAITSIKVKDFTVPGDISSAAFFIVAALITPGSDITIHNVGMNSTRSGIIDIVKEMKGNIEIINQTNTSEPTASIRIQYTPDLQPAELSGELITRAIDEIPIVALLCTQANGSSVIKDAEELKFKETNRIETTSDELGLLGFEVHPTDDGFIIHPSKFEHAASVSSYTDHRIGMTLAIASLLSDETLAIRNFDSVNTSFPEFLPLLKSISQKG
ncbi:3-phosphoshikimate 1-carboxyvinyltransferase [Staphylococcus carnosus]|uniref:3-phosphoshikimate 1-carboxyvinyltransferase n=3 Tax=Staphylococcus carnosus TaxID=1281 RepID=AROA_STACT|nr:3-phosphoshikimate 1-carboxyvinyltransferase [Staphylococcus carnosus]B9DNV0.1 RecName: Full=3-phosphoshikimate 1-carboxyvinyltransferase; AltName: Full=5-enolpyruvylshikimate-3-phosphate synthase; Short=EPSP synthase; Short=EPSPS [Staphylococcus carnosus subsp. carnosus TM300]ANZ33340.1 3-phosphoshikimate 1-carboxyvinyltransferase [Staphylococcus carnosus]KKB26254.1 3-phosphoshikimate 1-carboxyvinyltransferase [Staphylococcus carnosus]KOR13632.1 3-phosphoshikimate 1-carboxyvinyltransferase 